MESATIDTEIEDRSRVSPPSYCSELNIWNDNIQSFRPETSEALVLVFHAVRTSVSVPRMQTVRGPYVSFSRLLGPLHGQYKFENK